MTVLKSDALGVGLVGFGYAGRTFHAPLLVTTPGLSLRAVASGQPDAVRSALGPDVAVFPNASGLLARDDIALVVLATPNDSHHPLAREALLAGKAVVIDKPMALDFSEAIDLVRLAQQRRQLLSVFHNRRWDGDLLTVAELLREPSRLGRIAHAELYFDRFRPQVRARWREAAGPAGGMWLDLGAHLIDQALQLFGSPAALQADIAPLRDGATANDWFQAALRYDNGLRVTLGASMLTAQPRPRFALYGTQGSYVKYGLDAQEDALKAGQRPDPERPAEWGDDPQTGVVRSIAAGSADTAEPAEIPWPTLPGRYPHYYAGIRDALLGRGPNPVPPEQALRVMALLDLGRQSALARSELPVVLP